MDINNFMQYNIIEPLGLQAKRLERYYPSIENLLKNKTLRTFSQFIPYIYTFNLNLRDQTGEKTPRGGFLYYITDPYLVENKIEIISLEMVQGTNTFTDWNQQPATFNIEDMIIYGAITNIRSQINLSSKSFEFKPPNRVRLYGFNGYEQVELRAKIPYQSFAMVPESVSNSLEELAQLDVKIYLWGELAPYDNLETADGAIDLKISSWENAAEERKELLKDWMNKAFPNMATRPYTYE